MALITLAGFGLLSGRITMPLRGPWTIEAKVDTAELPTGTVTLTCDGGLELTGTVDATRSGVVLDSSHVWVVGGAGGLGKPVSGAWQSAQVRDPLDAILAASGETLSGAVDSGLLGTALARFSIVTTSCSAALTSLCTYASTATGAAINWRILEDGTLWLGAETWPAFTFDTTDSVAMVYPVLSKTVVSVSTPTCGPAQNVTGPAGEAIGNVAAVEHRIGPKGVQTWLFTDGDTSSEAGLFARNVRAALRLPPDPDSFPRIDHLALYPARIDAQASDGSTVDVTPLNPLISPTMALPFRVPIPGAVVLMQTGAICRVGWDEGDPSKMYAEPIFDKGATLTVLNIANGGSTKKAARNGDTVDMGQWQLIGSGSTFTGIRWQPPGGGSPQTIDTSGLLSLTGKVSSGSSKVLIGD